MSRDTLAAAKEELFDLLAPDGIPAVDGITAAVPYDPGPARIADLAEPVILTISTGTITPTSWVLTVRIVFDAEVDAAAAQVAADDIIPDVDLLLAPHWGPGDWECGPSDDLPTPYARPAWVAQTSVEVHRADGRLRPGLAQ